MRNLFINFKKSESGATLVEYGVALLLAIVLGGGALVALANQTGTNMSAGCGALQGNGVVEDGCDADATGAGDDSGTDSGTDP